MHPTLALGMDKSRARGSSSPPGTGDGGWGGGGKAAASPGPLGYGGGVGGGEHQPPGGRQGPPRASGAGRATVAGFRRWQALFFLGRAEEEEEISGFFNEGVQQG